MGFSLAGKDNPASCRLILEKIKEYCDKNPNGYPVILSMDVKNTSPECIQVLSELFQDIFGYSSYIWPSNNTNNSNNSKNSTNIYNTDIKLKDVMGKVLIKCGVFKKSDKNKDLWLHSHIAFPNNNMMKSYVDGKYDIFNEALYKRVYPKPSEMLSNNFDPLPYWKKKVQMVALNMQTNGKEANINTLVFYDKPFIHMNPFEMARIERICELANDMDFTKTSFLTSINRCKKNNRWKTVSQSIFRNKSNQNSEYSHTNKISLRQPLLCKNKFGCKFESCEKNDTIKPRSLSRAQTIKLPNNQSYVKNNEEFNNY